MTYILKSMDPEVRFERIEALLHAVAERENQMEIRFNQRTDRMAAENAAAIKRMDLFDKRLEATRKLVQAGIKLVTAMAQQQKEDRTEIRAPRRSQQAYFDSLRRSNGHGRY